MEAPHKAVGERLKRAREKAGLTQTALGDRVGLSQKQISTLESGYQLPMAGKLAPIVREVGGSIDWLMTGVGRAPVKKREPVAPTEPEGYEKDSTKPRRTRRQGA